MIAVHVVMGILNYESSRRQPGSMYGGSIGTVPTSGLDFYG
jgi:hypothetical protein